MMAILPSMVRSYHVSTGGGIDGLSLHQVQLGAWVTGRVGFRGRGEPGPVEQRASVRGRREQGNGEAAAALELAQIGREFARHTAGKPGRFLACSN